MVFGYLKKSVLELQEEIQHYSNELIKIASTDPRSAPFAVDEKTIGTKLQNMASDAGEQKIDLLNAGNRALAKIYAQEIDVLVQLAEIFYKLDVEKIGSGNARKIDTMCRILLVSTVEADKLFKAQEIIQNSMLRYPGAEARA